MKRLAIFVVLASLVSCASQGQQRKAEGPSTPQCLSMCSNQFAACTEEYPGDFSACRADRADCEQACTEQKALERMESDDGSEVMVPTDAEQQEMSPADGDEAAEPADDAEGGSTGDSSD